jgi:hypothetical protein
LRSKRGNFHKSTSNLIQKIADGMVLTWLALSGAACLLERFCPEPLVIQPMDEKFEGGGAIKMALRISQRRPSPGHGAATYFAKISARDCLRPMNFSDRDRPRGKPRGRAFSFL